MNLRQEIEVHNQIKSLIRAGVNCQHEIFNALYPTFRGHYSRLRDMIAEVKNEGVNND